LVAIIVRLDDLEELVGRKLPRDEEQLNELLYSIKCEISHPTLEGRQSAPTSSILDDSDLNIENVDTNRPDTWSPEGMARALKGLLGIELGIKKYPIARKPAVEISVDKRLREIRPFIACVVAQHPRINDTIIRGLIHLQEKLDQSYGRRRRRSSIGFYDFDLITPPLRYGVAGPDEIRFVPLEGVDTLSLREILKQHPKGIEYGHIVSQYPNLPILLDSKGKVLSFPPIINSNDLGRLTSDTKNILVEVTGTSEETVTNVLTILTTALADREAKIAPALVHYRYTKPRDVITPNLENRRIEIPLDMIKKMIGVNLRPQEIISLLQHARYDGMISGTKKIKALVPCYRMDILHPVDIIEDLAIAYGFNRIQPKWPSDPTIGGLSPLEEYSDGVRELMIGLGFQEVLTFIMTNQDKLFTKMNQDPTQIVEVANPKVTTLTSVRSWLLPSLMDFLASNTHVEYPQKLFEVGDCAVWNLKLSNRVRDVRKLACVSAHSRANFTEIKSVLEPLMMNLGFQFALSPVNHPSFLEGRTGSILIGDQEVGVIGEVHPQVIENWKLENPIAAMELDLGQLFGLQNEKAGEAPKPPTSERAN
jgi:phenylalanyl-tRNA synthetase beta chain